MNKYNFVPTTCRRINSVQLVGAYRLSTVAFALHYKPNWLHRTMSRILLGWKWEDYK